MLNVKVEESVKNESASSARSWEVVSIKEQGDISIDMLNVKVEESVMNESASSASAVEMMGKSLQQEAGRCLYWYA